MKNDAEMVEFADRDAYRSWLRDHHAQRNGIWITFAKGSKAFTANDALEESICFGWIDGVMKSIDDATYRKYFAPRKDSAKWSEKNKAIYGDLTERGLMTPAGVAVFKPSAANAQSAVDPGENIQALRAALAEDREIARLFDETSPSRQRQFAGFFREAKTDETRTKRKAKIISALREHYTGMLY